ncbi:MAG: ABC transporter permease [Ruminococcaceae bacterium]|nr:ABC transporter permease [Oscillospiraceae bacterium]
MKKYLLLQLKRLARILPPVLLVAAVLFGCMALAYDAIGDMTNEDGEQTKFKVGLVGTAGDTYMQMGLAAVQSFDSTRFSVQFVQMDENEAETALRRGKIAAFIQFPEGFMDAAMYGNILPMKFVASVGSDSLVTMIKEELTGIVEIMIAHTQKGIYGAGAAAGANGGNAGAAIGDISLQYVDFIISRSKAYKVTESGVFDGLGMEGYLISGLGIVLFMLICLIFAPVMIRREQAMARMLKSRSRPVWAQVLCDFAVYMAGLLGIACVVLVLLLLRPESQISGQMILQCLPVVFSLGAMSFLMYEAASDLISGVLMQFFVTLALCFVSGCLYPITFFPNAVQKIAKFLPTGIAREQVGNCILGVHSPETLAALLGFGCLFLAGSMLIRQVKVTGVRG